MDYQLGFGIKNTLLKIERDKTRLKTQSLRMPPKKLNISIG
jgi:hypothetical protein